MLHTCSFQRLMLHCGAFALALSLLAEFTLSCGTVEGSDLGFVCISQLTNCLESKKLNFIIMLKSQEYRDV